MTQGTEVEIQTYIGLTVAPWCPIPPPSPGTIQTFSPLREGGATDPQVKMAGGGEQRKESWFI